MSFPPRRPPRARDRASYGKNAITPGGAVFEVVGGSLSVNLSRPMASWVIRGDQPRPFEPTGSGIAARAWAWDLERVADGTERPTIEVRVVEVVFADMVLVALQSRSEVPEEVRQAYETHGKSQVELWLDEAELPQRIVIHTHGASPRPGSA